MSACVNRIALLCGILTGTAAPLFAQSSTVPQPRSEAKWFIDTGWIWDVDRTERKRPRPVHVSPGNVYEDTGREHPGGRIQFGAALGPRTSARLVLESAVPQMQLSSTRFREGESRNRNKFYVTTATGLIGFRPRFAERWQLGLLAGGGVAWSVRTSRWSGVVSNSRYYSEQFRPMLSLGIEAGLSLDERVTIVPQANLHLLFGTDYPVSFRPGIAARVSLSRSTRERTHFERSSSHEESPRPRRYFVDGGVIFDFDRTQRRFVVGWPLAPPQSYDDTGRDRAGGRLQVGRKLTRRSSVRLLVEANRRRDIMDFISFYDRRLGEGSRTRYQLTTVTPLIAFHQTVNRFEFGVLGGIGVARTEKRFEWWASRVAGPSTRAHQHEYRPTLSAGAEAGYRVGRRLVVVTDVTFHSLFGTTARTAFRPGLSLRATF